MTRITGMAGICVTLTSQKLLAQAAPHCWSGDLPVFYRNSRHRVTSRGRGTAGSFSQKEPFLGMLTARTWMQCFSMYKKEGDKFPVFFFPFVSEFWCQSTMLMPELGAERGQGTGGGHSCTAGKMFLLVSNMHLSLFCHLFGLIHSLLHCLRCTNTQHHSMKLS